MFEVKLEVKEAIYRGHDRNMPIRRIATVAGCAKNTVVRYLRLEGKETMSRSKAASRYRELNKKGSRNIPHVHCPNCGCNSRELEPHRICPKCNFALLVPIKVDVKYDIIEGRI